MLAAWLAALLLLSQPVTPVDVALDPGHSTADVGAASGNLREYVLTMPVHEGAREMLEELRREFRIVVLTARSGEALEGQRGDASGSHHPQRPGQVGHRLAG